MLKYKCVTTLVWSTRLGNFYNNTFPEQVRLVNQYTYDFYKELASSRIWIANSVEFLKNPIYKKKSQILIETWHGSLGIKRFDKTANSGTRWVEAAELNGKIANYCISNSVFEDKVYRDSFWPKTEILRFGHPRNDILAVQNASKRKQLRNDLLEQFGVEQDSKVVLYAPTFRDSHTFSCYNIEFSRLTKVLKEKFGGSWIILLRYHPTVRKKTKNVFASDIIDVTSHPDMQELIAIADIAITDYSSWIYDFVLLRKPGFIYATDIDHYNNERGFYYSLESTPFPVATTNEELMTNIIQFDQIIYENRVEEFLREKGCCEDGNASKRVVEKIQELISGKKK